jgi:crotonobetainyl-CoA:carnitine CoA-transferase CaiB-like acyl-CoA transferase
MCPLKHGEAVDAVLRLLESAWVLIEGYRPGVTNVLG